MSVIDQDGAPQEWTSVYYRHHVRCTETHDSLEEALSFLSYGEDYGEHAASGVLDPGGRPVFASEDECFAAVNAYSNGRFKQWAERVRSELATHHPPTAED